jgi:hypothetical protein
MQLENSAGKCCTDAPFCPYFTSNPFVQSKNQRASPFSEDVQLIQTISFSIAVEITKITIPRRTISIYNNAVAAAAAAAAASAIRSSRS